MAIVYDSSGKTINLNGELNRGGEGIIYFVSGQDDLVAKLYTKGITQEKAAKVESMANISNTELQRIAAWPLEPLYTSKNNGFTGFLMPKASGYKDIHKLYGPSSRKQDFPTADWRFIIRAARNLATAVNVIHEKGIVIGDLNEGNIFVSQQDATIRFLDCDSFQVSVGSKLFPCEVGVGLYTPPELQGKSFKGITRTRNHDYFGLAVLIFRLLFIARHPFAGLYTGKGEQPAIEKAIENYWFCYGANAHQFHMAPPPNNLTLADLPSKVSTLFERAFSQEAVRQSNRPTAIEWIEALDFLEKNLKVCSSNNSHNYYSGASSCPWCRIESTGAVIFMYTGTGKTPSGQTVNVTVIWQRISGISSPGAAPTITTPSMHYLTHTPLSPKAQKAVQRHKLHQFFSISTILVIGCSLLYSLMAHGHYFWGIIGGIILWNITEGVRKAQADLGGEHQARSKALKEAQERFDFSKAKWDKDASDRKFNEKLKELSKAYMKAQSLEQEHQKERQRLENDRRNYQLKKYLEQSYIEDADLSGIGEGLKAKLQSYGYETAADLINFMPGQVPGFGDVRAATLITWRKNREANFVFNPNQPIDPRDLQALKNKYEGQKQALIQVLQQGEHELQNIKQDILKKRSSWLPQLERLASDLAQKKMDMKVF